MKDSWIDATKVMPRAEVPVLVHCVRTRGDKKYDFVATCFYEDGTIWREESAYVWEFDYDYPDVALKYDEEKDDYLVCEGWFESVNFSDSFNAIDSDVEIVAWMPLPTVN